MSIILESRTSLVSLFRPPFAKIHREACSHAASGQEQEVPESLLVKSKPRLQVPEIEIKVRWCPQESGAAGKQVEPAGDLLVFSGLRLLWPLPWVLSSAASHAKDNLTRFPNDTTTWTHWIPQDKWRFHCGQPNSVGWWGTQVGFGALDFIPMFLSQDHVNHSLSDRSLNPMVRGEIRLVRRREHCTKETEALRQLPATWQK